MESMNEDECDCEIYEGSDVDNWEDEQVSQDHEGQEPICSDCEELTAAPNSEFCDECLYERGEPTEPWQPDPREDGGYFGMMGIMED